jgi:hypothetical protein
MICEKWSLSSKRLRKVCLKIPKNRILINALSNDKRIKDREDEHVY